MESLNPRMLWEIFKHIRRWLANLSRAGQQRQQESITALRAVIIAARETNVYMRQMQETQQRKHTTERHLATLWTQLGFDLDDLGLTKLAKRCHITGKNWADPSFYDKVFIEKADISLEQMERLAKYILLQLNKR